MLQIKNVHKYFNKGRRNQIHVINDTSLTLGDSGLVALLGPSGCGKTTLLNCVGGLDKIKKGSIYINDKKISSRCSHKVDRIRNINVGYIFQDYKLIDNKTVFDNVALVLTMLGVKDKKEIKNRVEYVLDKVGMLRYKRRPAAMLSGGERQRVAIARAIVKDPNIILADEPTGNLDSKNSLEIMRIIKAISKEKLVLLVTHEQELAKFYADRIVEIEDGTVKNDYKNDDVEDLDYIIDNNFYLKDLNKDELSSKKNNINIYTDKTSESIDLDIVIRRGNIYIRSNTKDKIEIVDENSSIEMIDDHYKKIDKSDFENYKFELDKVIKKQYKKKYCSIFNPITLITNGFKKVFDFPITKKILLAGFVLSGAFIMYAVSSISAAITVRDSDFVRYNKNYLTITQKKLDIDNFLDYEREESINYILPTNSIVNFNLKYDFYYQSYYSYDRISPSLASIDMISESDLIYGKMPENDHEVVLDKLVLDRLRSTNKESIMVGIYEIKDFIGLKLTMDNLNPYVIVGISDLNSPSIYTYNSQFYYLLSNSKDNYYDSNSKTVYDYELYLSDELWLREGRLPYNDYEVIVNINNKEIMPINKQISDKVNEVKLTVVGYYESKRGLDLKLSNANIVKYETILNSENMVIYSNDKEETISYFENNKTNIYDSYKLAKKEYKDERKEYVKGVLIASGVILLISLIEIFLMIRSSFLSRIKEVGIYRAIGVKKQDIYKMFFGEIIAITTIASVPGLIGSAYVLYKLSTIGTISSYFIINPFIIMVSIICMYGFNLIIGLLPVYNTIKHKPAEILARHDLD